MRLQWQGKQFMLESAMTTVDYQGVVVTESEVQRFLKAIGEQPELDARLRAEGADPVTVAAEAGFEFDADTLKAVLTEVSDAELDSVAGGIGVPGGSVPRPPENPFNPPPLDLGDDDPMGGFFGGGG